MVRTLWKVSAQGTMCAQLRSRGYFAALWLLRYFVATSLLCGYFATSLLLRCFVATSLLHGHFASSWLIRVFVATGRLRGCDARRAAISPCAGTRARRCQKSPPWQSPRTRPSYPSCTAPRCRRR
eukprot:5705021-Pleurochrysis_carterae.AAC.2